MIKSNSNQVANTSNIHQAAIAKSLEKMTEAIERCYLVKQQEETKREAIRAYRDVELKKLKNQKQNFEQYINYVFQERRINFDKFFQQLDIAIETDNMELANIVMAGIIQQIQNSPLQGVQELLIQVNDSNCKHIEF